MFFRPRLAVVYVEYNRDKYAGVFQKLKGYLRNLDRRRTTYVVVNNKEEGNGWKLLDDGTYYIQGDNVEREFSGWQKGVEFLSERKIPFDVVLFVNEALEVVQPTYLSDSNVGWLVLKTHLIKAAFGYIDTLWEKTTIHGKSTRLWINTNCFFLPASLLHKLGSLVSVDRCSINDYLPEEFPNNGEMFAKQSPINSVYKDHLITWFTEDWHGRLVLDRETWPIFRAKTKAILNEALLSVRIREQGHWILPYSVPSFIFLKTRGLFRRVKKLTFGDRGKLLEHPTLQRPKHHDGVS